MPCVFEQPALYQGILYRKAMEFAVRIVKLYKYLMQKNKSLEALYVQLLKAGTSVGANVSEAQSAISKKDFINKLSISLKESRESDYWLKVFHRTEIINDTEYESLIKDCDELERLLTSSIKTARGI